MESQRLDTLARTVSSRSTTLGRMLSDVLAVLGTHATSIDRRSNSATPNAIRLVWASRRERTA